MYRTPYLINRVRQRNRRDEWAVDGTEPLSSSQLAQRRKTTPSMTQIIIIIRTHSFTVICISRVMEKHLSDGPLPSPESAACDLWPISVSASEVAVLSFRNLPDPI